MGFLLLAALTALAFVGGAALAHRGWGRREVEAEGSRAEGALAASVLGLSLILIPIHVLGWTETLSPTMMALSIAGASLAAFAVGAGLSRPSGREGWIAAAREQLSAAGRYARLPADALIEAWQARSATLFALLVLYGVWLYTAILAWLAPSSSWDGLMYHEAMAAYALQNGGYQWVEMPPDIQLVNGFPRGAEALQLYLVAFTDRTLIDFAQHLTAVPVVLAIYLLCRRFAPRLLSAGLAASAFLVPGYALQLRSTYVDVTVTAMLLASVYFVTRPRLRVRDLWMVALTASLYGGMKANAPVIAPILLGAGLLRSLPMLRPSRALGATLLAYLGGLVLVAGLAAPTYVRNYLETENPAWPVDIRIEILDLEFDGTWNVQDQHNPVESVVSDMYAPPKPGDDFVDTRQRGYGHAVPFLVLPLALLGLAIAIRHGIGSLVFRDPPVPGTFNILMVSAVVLLAQVPSPAYWWARFNLHGLALVFVLAAWLLRFPSRQRWAEAVVGACTTFAVVTLWWAEPAWDVSFEEATELASIPAEVRATRRIGWALMMEDAAKAREREIGPGDVVAWSGGFIGVAWNEELSNDVVWIPHGPRYVERLLEANAEWAIVRKGDASEQVLRRSREFEPVADVGPRVVAFRRTSL